MKNGFQFKGALRHKEKIKNEYVRLKQDEEVAAVLQGLYIPSFEWLFLIGPLRGMRDYFIGVTAQGLHLHRTKFLWKTGYAHNFFPYAEITEIKLGHVFLQTPAVQMIFSDGRTLKLSMPLNSAHEFLFLVDCKRRIWEAIK